MTKLRFIKDDSLVMKEYIEYCPSYLATKIITIRLNMSKVKENYRKKNVAPQCRLCHETEENTEHMLVCSMIEPETINVSGLKQTDNFNIWKNIVHRVDIFEKRIEERKTGITRDRGSTAGLNDLSSKLPKASKSADTD